ncbi:MAG: hypothetical protein ABEI86_10345 [Halobacteriaceae archaeon]
MTYEIKEFSGSLFDYVLMDHRGNEIPIPDEDITEIISALQNAKGSSQ